MCVIVVIREFILTSVMSVIMYAFWKLNGNENIKEVQQKFVPLIWTK